MVDLDFVGGETFAGMLIGSALTTLGTLGIFLGGFWILDQSQFFTISIDQFLKNYGIAFVAVSFSLNAIGDVFASIGVEIIQ